MKKLYSMILAVVMTVIATAIPVYAGGAYDIVEVGGSYNLHLYADETQIFEFYVEEDGWYSIYTEGDADTIGAIYNENWEEIDSCDDTNEGLNFFIKTELFTGYRYYIEVRRYYFEDEGFDLEADTVLHIEKAVPVEDVEIIQYPYTMTLIDGYEYDSCDFSGLKVKLFYEDGTAAVWSYDEPYTGKPVKVDCYMEEDGMGNYYFDAYFDNAFVREFYDIASTEQPRLVYVDQSDEGMYMGIYSPSVCDYKIAYVDYDSTGAFEKVVFDNYTAEWVGFGCSGAMSDLSFDTVDKVILFYADEDLKPASVAFTLR